MRTLLQSSLLILYQSKLKRILSGGVDFPWISISLVIRLYCHSGKRRGITAGGAKRFYGVLKIGQPCDHDQRERRHPRGTGDPPRRNSETALHLRSASAAERFLRIGQRQRHREDAALIDHTRDANIPAMGLR